MVSRIIIFFAGGIVSSVLCLTLAQHASAEGPSVAVSNPNWDGGAASGEPGTGSGASCRSSEDCRCDSSCSEGRCVPNNRYFCEDQGKCADNRFGCKDEECRNCPRCQACLGGRVCRAVDAGGKWCEADRICIKDERPCPVECDNNRDGLPDCPAETHECAQSSRGDFRCILRNWKWHRCKDGTLRDPTQGNCPEDEACQVAGRGCQPCTERCLIDFVSGKGTCTKDSRFNLCPDGKTCVVRGAWSTCPTLVEE